MAPYSVLKLVLFFLYVSNVNVKGSGISSRIFPNMEGCKHPSRYVKHAIANILSMHFLCARVDINGSSENKGYLFTSASKNDVVIILMTPKHA